jgi:hypothetical protein
MMQEEIVVSVLRQTALDVLLNGPRVYSTAPEAARKRLIDEQIMGGNLANAARIDMNNEAYLKELIKLSSNGKKSVSASASGLQFFIVQGGGEGFLDPSYEGKDASRVFLGGGVTTSGAPGTAMIFDDNDLIAAFDQKGKLINSALLRRPIAITNPNIWTEGTANKVYEAWDGSPVGIYRNTNPRFSIWYYGLWINDKLGYYNKGWVRIDLHKEEATNGCIFIKDPDTPPLSETIRLNAFEPQFIKDIQSHIGAKTKPNIGTMHMIDIGTMHLIDI